MLKRTFIPKNIYQEHLFQSRSDPYYNNSALTSSQKQSSFQSMVPIKDKDVRIMVMQFMNEVNRRGGFHLVYPCENYHHYAKYFEKERPADRAINDHLTKLKQRMRGVAANSRLRNAIASPAAERVTHHGKSYSSAELG